MCFPKVFTVLLKSDLWEELVGVTARPNKLSRGRGAGAAEIHVEIVKKLCSCIDKMNNLGM